MTEMVVRCRHDELMDTAELLKRQHPENPNDHPPSQITRLAEIMAYQGVRHPIVISNLSGRISKGHGRLMSAIENKWDKFPVEYQDYVNEEQEYADVVADNAIASWAELNLAAINVKIPSLGPDLDINMLGIKDFVLEPADKYGDKDADEVPTTRDTDIKRGDLFALGSHRLLCGDSTDLADVERLMNGEKADMVYTDPPYGMNLGTKRADDLGQTEVHIDGRAILNPKRKNWKPIEGDSTQYDPTFLLQCFDYCDEIFLWGANYYWDFLPNSRISGLVVWDKKNNVDDMAFGSDFEVCWSKAKHKQGFVRLTWSGIYGTGQEFDNKRSHPSHKPHKLGETFFERWGKDKTNIVDLYLGSGSTLIACEKTQRRCFGMEIDPQYIDVIIRRWEAFTNGKAEILFPDGSKRVWSEVEQDRRQSKA